MKPIKKGLAAGNRGRAPAPIQNLLQGKLQLFHALPLFPAARPFLMGFIGALPFLVDFIGAQP
jgi:hypothetical protein